MKNYCLGLLYYITTERMILLKYLKIYSNNFLDTNLKIILLDYQNNYEDVQVDC